MEKLSYKWHFLTTKGDHPVLAMDLVRQGHDRFFGKILNLPFNINNLKRDRGATFILEKDYKKIICYLRPKLRRNLGEFYEFLDFFLKKHRDLINFLERVKATRIKDLPDKEIKFILNKFFIHFSQISIHFYFVFIFEDLLTEELKKILLPKLKKLKKEEKLEKYLFYLTQETRGSGVFQEKIALLKIASVIYRNKKWRALFKKGKVKAIKEAVLKDPLGKRILAHQKKYPGLHSYFFYVKEYNLRDIIKGIKEGLAINPQKTLNNLIGSQEELKKIQKQILKEVKLEKEELKILKLAQAYGYFRNIRIGQIGSSQVLIKPILAEWAKRLKLTYEEIIYLTSQETLSGVFDKKELGERKKGYIYLLEKGQ